MKKILKIATLFLLSIISIFSFTSINTNAGILGSSDWEIYLCKWNDCGFEQWVILVKESGIDWLDTSDKKASDKIQDIVKYLLWFLTLIAVIYIIYAGFRILTSSGDDDTIKNSKKTIIYVIVWILVIWFAWTIANFAFEIWTATTS